MGDPQANAPEVFIETKPFSEEIVRWWFKRIPRSDRVDLNQQQSIILQGNPWRILNPYCDPQTRLTAPKLITGPMFNIPTNQPPPNEIWYRDQANNLLGRVVLVGQ